MTIFPRLRYVRGAVKVRPKTIADEPWLRAFLEREWGGTSMLVHGDEIDLTAFPALVADRNAGIAIFRADEPAELLLLSAAKHRAGVGSALLSAVVATLRARGRRSLRVTTTNDNLDALRFYQRRGFRLVDLRPGALSAARRRKPSIPDRGKYGIPLTDELDLVLDLFAVAEQ